MLFLVQPPVLCRKVIYVKVPLSSLWPVRFYWRQIFANSVFECATMSRTHLCPQLRHAGDSWDSNTWVLGRWWARPVTLYSTYCYQQPASNCCALPENQLSRNRCSLRIRNSTGVAHKRANSHYTLHIEHVEKYATRHEWQNTTAIFSFWILLLLFPWRHNAHTLRCRHIGRRGGVCVTSRLSEKHVGRCAESHISPGNSTTDVILVRYNKKTRSPNFQMRYFHLYCIGWHLLIE
jgi:hypothetical protein